MSGVNFFYMKLKICWCQELNNLLLYEVEGLLMSRVKKTYYMKLKIGWCQESFDWWMAGTLIVQNLVCWFALVYLSGMDSRIVCLATCEWCCGLYFWFLAAQVSSRGVSMAGSLSLASSMVVALQSLIFSAAMMSWRRRQMWKPVVVVVEVAVCYQLVSIPE